MDSLSPKKLLPFFAAALVLSGAVYLFFSRGMGSQELFFYDWQPRLPIQAPERKLLDEKTAGRIFLKFGTFDLQGGHLVYRHLLTQKTLQSYGPVRITACYRLEFGLAAAFKDQDPETLCRFILSTVSEDLRGAGGFGAGVDGLNLDFDCPDSQLPRYARLLARLKAGWSLPPGTELSVTSLASWMFHPLDFGNLLKQVDYHVPLFFGYGVGPTLSRLGPLMDPGSFRRSLFLAALYGKKFYLGLPDYSTVEVYGPDGELLSVESGLPVRVLLAQEALRQTGGGLDGPGGGTRMEFEVTRPVLVAGRSLRAGWKVAAQESDGQLLRGLAQTARDHGTPACAGFILYRLDKQGGLLGLSPQAAVLACQGGSIEPSIKTAILDFAMGKKGAAFKVALWNDSEFPSRPLKLPAFVQVRWKNGELAEASPGGFSSFFWCHGFESDAAPCSQPRANQLRFMVRRLEPHARWVSGPIRVRPLDPDFALYLYANVPDSTRWVREIVHDYEVYPSVADIDMESQAIEP